MTTSSMGLGPDYDKKFYRLPYGTFSKVPLPSDPRSSHDTYPLNLDETIKGSMVAMAERRGRKYASAFKSKTPSGLQLRPSTSGPLGPGSFPGAEVSSLVVKDPYNRSASFLTYRRTKQPFLPPENLNEMKPFSEVHNKGIKISETGARPGKVHMTEWTKKKVCKIYPKLAKEMYGDTNG